MTKKRQKRPTQRIVFEPKASLPKEAFVLIFDLEGFSHFFSQPDVQDYVVKYLNHVFHAVSLVIDGGKHYWLEGEYEKKIMPSFLTPAHTRFLGDGALYVWTFNRGQKEKKMKDIVYFINRMWNLKIRFDEVVKKALEDVPVADLPRKIRFGFSSGSVYKLNHKNSNQEQYIGYCINLASRLQSYSRELGFICSARVDMPQKLIDEYNYLKVTAKNLSGFGKEVVIVDKKEYELLSPERREELFE